MSGSGKTRSNSTRRLNLGEAPRRIHAGTSAAGNQARLAEAVQHSAAAPTSRSSVAAAASLAGAVAAQAAASSAPSSAAASRSAAAPVARSLPVAAPTNAPHRFSHVFDSAASKTPPVFRLPKNQVDPLRASFEGEYAIGVQYRQGQEIPFVQRMGSQLLRLEDLLPGSMLSNVQPNSQVDALEPLYNMHSWAEMDDRMNIENLNSLEGSLSPQEAAELGQHKTRLPLERFKTLSKRLGHDFQTLLHYCMTHACPDNKHYGNVGECTRKQNLFSIPAMLRLIMCAP
jgi:hypothetical protein